MMRMPAAIRSRNFLRRGSFGRSVLLLTGGTAIGQAITILASPVLTRLYTRDQFGILVSYVAIVSVAVVVVSGRYELAIPLPEDDSEAANILALSLAVLFGICAAAAIALWFTADALAIRMGAPALSPYLRLLPVSLLGAGAYQALSYWAVRKQRYPLIARTKMVQGAAQAAVQIGVGLLHSGPAGLIAGDLAGRSGGVTQLAGSIARAHEATVRSISWQGMKEAARRYVQFPRVMVVTSLVDALGMQSAALLLPSFYGTGSAGLYSLAQRVMMLPMALIGQSVAQVYMGEAATRALTDRRSILPLVRVTVTRLAGIGALPVLALVVGGPLLFRFVFGEHWAEAGAYARILAPMTLIQFAISPISTTFCVLEMQRWQFAWTVLLAACAVAGLALPHALGWSAQAALLGYSGALSVGYLSLPALIYAALRRRGDD